MSILQMTKAWNCDLPSNKLFILVTLADFADDQGNNIFPEIGRIAWKTGYTERQVYRIIKELKDSGALIPNGRHGRAINYRLDLSQAPQKPTYIRREPKKRSRTLTKCQSSPISPDSANPDKMSDLTCQNVRSDLTSQPQISTLNHQLTIHDPSDSKSLNRDFVEWPQNLPPTTVTPKRPAPPILNQDNPVQPRTKTPKQPVLDPKRDLIFEFVVTCVLQAALKDVKTDKDLQGRANKLAAKIVNAAKTRLNLTAKQPLPIEERARIASRLPGLVVFYQTKKPNTEFPTGNGTFATLISQWFEAGCPGKQPVSSKPVLNYDPNCPHRADVNPCDNGFIVRVDERGLPAPIPCECQLRIIAERKGQRFP